MKEQKLNENFDLVKASIDMNWYIHAFDVIHHSNCRKKIKNIFDIAVQKKVINPCGWSFQHHLLVKKFGIYFFVVLVFIPNIVDKYSSYTSIIHSKFPRLSCHYIFLVLSMTFILYITFNCYYKLLLTVFYQFLSFCCYKSINLSHKI